MCLHVNHKMTSDWKRRGKNGRTITCYKVVSYTRNQASGELALVSPIYCSHEWRPGENKADIVYHIRGNNRINEGIHVFVRLDHAKRYAVSSADRVMKVECKISDLLGVECFYNREKRKNYACQMVFTKVYLSQEEFDKANQ